MLATDLATNPNTAIAQGTSASATHSLLSIGAGRSVRSDASVATTNPSQISIAHQTRVIKGFKSVANSAVPAADVIVDRHLIRLDENCVQTSRLDPEFRINSSVQLVIERPRLGSETPDSTDVADGIKRLVAMLDASTQANLKRVLNGEL